MIYDLCSKPWKPTVRVEANDVSEACRVFIREFGGRTEPIYVLIGNRGGILAFDKMCPIFNDKGIRHSAANVVEFDPKKRVQDNDEDGDEDISDGGLA